MWSSSLLSQVRDLVFQAALQVVFHPGSIVSKPDKVDTLEDILSRLDLPSLETYPQTVTAAPMLSILKSFTEDIHEFTQQVTAGDETTVIVHSGLPGVKVVTGSACQYSVVAVAGTVATIKCGDKPHISLPELPLPHNAAAGDLCLFSEGTTSHRAVLTDISEYFADVWLIDTGVSIVCDPTELFSIPTELCSQPPAVFTVIMAGEHSLAGGDRVTGTVSVAGGGLVLQVGE